MDCTVTGDIIVRGCICAEGSGGFNRLHGKANPLMDSKAGGVEYSQLAGGRPQKVSHEVS